MDGSAAQHRLVVAVPGLCQNSVAAASQGSVQGLRPDLDQPFTVLSGREFRLGVSMAAQRVRLAPWAQWTISIASRTINVPMREATRSSTMMGQIGDPQLVRRLGVELSAHQVNLTCPQGPGAWSALSWFPGLRRSLRHGHESASWSGPISWQERWPAFQSTSIRSHGCCRTSCHRYATSR